MISVIYRMATATSMGATFTGAPMNTRYIETLGIHFTYTATAATGTFTAEGSNDSQSGTDGTWFSVALDAALNPSASAGATYGQAIAHWGYAWIRIKYTRTSGTGTIDIIALGKEF